MKQSEFSKSKFSLSQFKHTNRYLNNIDNNLSKFMSSNLIEVDLNEICFGTFLGGSKSRKA